MTAIKKIKKTCDMAIINAQLGLAADASDETPLIKKKKTGLACAKKGLLASLATLMMSPLAFAAESETQVVADAISSGAQEIYALVRSVAVPVCTVAIVICAIIYFIGGEEGMKKGKFFAKGIILTLAVIGLAPIIGPAVYSMFKQETGDAFNVTVE